MDTPELDVDALLERAKAGLKQEEKKKTATSGKLESVKSESVSPVLAGLDDNEEQQQLISISGDSGDKSSGLYGGRQVKDYRDKRSSLAEELRLKLADPRNRTEVKIRPDGKPEAKKVAASMSKSQDTGLSLVTSLPSATIRTGTEQAVERERKLESSTDKASNGDRVRALLERISRVEDSSKRVEDLAKATDASVKSILDNYTLFTCNSCSTDFAAPTSSRDIRCTSCLAVASLPVGKDNSDYISLLKIAADRVAALETENKDLANKLRELEKVVGRMSEEIARVEHNLSNVKEAVVGSVLIPAKQRVLVKR